VELLAFGEFFSILLDRGKRLKGMIREIWKLGSSKVMGAFHSLHPLTLAEE